ncbi:M3 family metallopeptidase [Streptomyces sp. NPDC085466]|uniref:M3 family metallopeptidase n=1 Tax=Streptomyces sp. NPDC085466 TaxID=3365725 RepID=UPI0037D5903C
MQLDAITSLDESSLVATEKILDGAKSRLDAILAEHRLTEESFVELAAIYDNVAYVFLYLESNEQYVDYRWLLPYRDAFFKDQDLDRTLLALCESLRCADPDIEESRRAYVRHLTDKLAADRTSAAELARLQDQAKDIVQAGRDDQLAFLTRLGVGAEGGTADTIGYTLISATPDAARRSKLSGAMSALRDRRLGPLIDTVDRMIDIRRATSRRQGARSVLEQTMRRCAISEETAQHIVDAYVSGAVEDRALLDAEIREAIGDVATPVDHFGHWVRTLQGDLKVPLFDLGACLEFIEAVAARVFGLSMRRLPDSGPGVWTVVVLRDDEAIGYINFDLWDSGRNRTANSTSGIRNRVDWGSIVQLPIAYISCRFHRNPDGREIITFQNVHSLFHEVGHALNHILIRKRLPTLSGLDYLPLERIEDLSMWTEKWVYHADFVSHLDLSEEEREGMRFCQRVKILEYRRNHIDRAVTAALDFEVHRANSGGLREAFERLDDRFGVARHCSLGEFPVYFAWPMINANPGATFAYTRSAAESAESFAPLLSRRLADLEPAEFAASFDACFDFDEPSSGPDIGSVFAFYNDALWRSAE